jgi:hypothetical protein
MNIYPTILLIEKHLLLAISRKCLLRLLSKLLDPSVVGADCVLGGWRAQLALQF